MSLLSFMVDSAYRLSLAALAMVVLSACSEKEQSAQAPRPAHTMAVAPDASTIVWSLPCQVAPREATPLSFRVQGKIIDRAVRTGDTVSKGQVLAKLDPRQVEQSTQSAQAQLKAAQQALEFARRTLNRDRQQAKADLIAPAQLEQSQNAYAQALAQNTQAQQQAELAADQLDYSQLVANHDGVITSEHAQTGQNVGAGQAIYTLAWDAGLDVVCDVPERTLASLQPKQAAIIKLTASPDLALPATLREIAPMADPASRTFRVKLSLDDAPVDVRLGMTATAQFSKTVAATQSVSYSLPSTALFHDGPDPAVWVLEPSDSSLQLRKVQLLAHGQDTVTIGQGLNPGDLILVKGVHTVAAGEIVRPIRVDVAAEPQP